MTSGEIWRFQCEVRHVLRLRFDRRDRALSYIDLVEKRRGKDAADAIMADAKQQWDRGNRGELGKWKQQGENHDRHKKPAM